MSEITAGPRLAADENEGLGATADLLEPVGTAAPGTGAAAQYQPKVKFVADGAKYFRKGSQR